MIATLNGKRYNFNIRDKWISDKLVIGEAERNTYRIKPDHFTGDKVFLDIGANIGAQSLFVNSLVPDARIIAFEPQPDNLRLLRENIELNGKSVEIDGRGVWHTAGKAKIHEAGGNSYMDEGGHDEIELITIEEIFDEYNLDEVSVLKVDIEHQNAEKLLLETPIDVLTKCHLIIIEFDGYEGSDDTLLGKVRDYLSDKFVLDQVGNEKTGGYLWATRN